MTDTSLPTIYSFTLVEEEGHQTAPLAGDPGGATNWGITIGTLSQWLGRPAEPAEVYALSLGEAQTILRAWYYRGVGAQVSPAGIDLMLTDHAFNAGVADMKRIVETIQGSLACEVDGIAGPLTTAAAGGVGPLLAILRDHQEDDYRSKSDFPAFGAEWLGRLGRRYEAALSLAGLPAASA